MLYVHTFGKTQIETGETRFAANSVRKLPMLLYLSVERGRRVSRAIMHELVFPDQTARNAKHSLRELVYQLRLVGVPIESDGDTIELNGECVRADYADILAAERVTGAQLAAVESGFLPGYAPEHSEAFTEWLDRFRAKTTFDLGKAIVREVTRARSVADWITTERAARACLTVNPFNEEATLALAEMLAINGAKAQAMTLLDQYLLEVGAGSRDLKLPALVLKRRISERVPQSYAARSMSPFVGRDREMLALHEHSGRARGGASECVVLLGDPGIGKSRLAAEFCTAAMLDGAAVVSASPQPHDVHRPFGGFADLVPQLLESRGALGCSPESMRALDKLTTTPSADATPFADAIRDSEALCDATTRAILDIVDAIASEQLLVISIEDIHWLDEMSLRVLGYLLATQRSRRLFVLLTTRTSAPVNEISRHALAVRVLPLAELDADAVQRMTEAFSLDSGLSVDAEMLRWLGGTANGNPLFVESLLGHFANTKERFAISPTLSSLLGRRVECLSSHATTTLQICALLGKHATLETMMTAVELNRFDLIRAVGELESARLIKSEEERVRPAHALIADVALGRMSAMQKRLAHQCVAMALESLEVGERTVALVWECAEHWLAAGDSSRAVDAIRRCADHALEIGRPADVAEMLSRALDLSTYRDDRIDLATRLVFAADVAVDPTRALQGVAVLRELSADGSDEIDFAEFRARARACYNPANDVDKLLGWIRHDDSPANHRVLAATWILKYADLGDPRTAVERVIATLPVEVINAADRLVALEFDLVRSSTLEDHDRAPAIAREILRSAECDPVSIPLALQNNAAMVLERSGYTEEAVHSAEKLYDRIQAAGGHRLGVYMAVLAAECHANLGDRGRSLEWLQRISTMEETWPSIRADMSFLPARIVCLVEVGEMALARSLFDRAEAAGAFASSTFGVRFRTVARVRFAQLQDGSRASDEDLATILENLENRFLMTGLRDFETLTAFIELDARGRTNEAHRLLNWYWQTGRSCRSLCLRSLSVVVDRVFQVGS